MRWLWGLIAPISDTVGEDSRLEADTFAEEALDECFG